MAPNIKESAAVLDSLAILTCDDLMYHEPLTIDVKGVTTPTTSNSSESHDAIFHMDNVKANLIKDAQRNSAVLVDRNTKHHHDHHWHWPATLNGIKKAIHGIHHCNDDDYVRHVLSIEAIEASLIRDSLHRSMVSLSQQHGIQGTQHDDVSYWDM